MDSVEQYILIPHISKLELASGESKDTWYLRIGYDSVDISSTMLYGSDDDYDDLKKKKEEIEKAIAKYYYFNSDPRISTYYMETFVFRGIILPKVVKVEKIYSEGGLNYYGGGPVFYAFSVILEGDECVVWSGETRDALDAERTDLAKRIEHLHGSDSVLEI